MTDPEAENIILSSEKGDSRKDAGSLPALTTATCPSSPTSTGSRTWKFSPYESSTGLFGDGGYSAYTSHKSSKVSKISLQELEDLSSAKNLSIPLTIIGESKFSDVDSSDLEYSGTKITLPKPQDSRVYDVEASEVGSIITKSVPSIIRETPFDFDTTSQIVDGFMSMMSSPSSQLEAEAVKSLNSFDPHVFTDGVGGIMAFRMNVIMSALSRIKVGDYDEVLVYRSNTISKHLEALKRTCSLGFNVRSYRSLKDLVSRAQRVKKTTLIVVPYDYPAYHSLAQSTGILTNPNVHHIVWLLSEYAISRLPETPSFVDYDPETSGFFVEEVRKGKKWRHNFLKTSDENVLISFGMRKIIPSSLDTPSNVFTAIYTNSFAFDRGDNSLKESGVDPTVTYQVQYSDSKNSIKMSKIEPTIAHRCAFLSTKAYVKGMRPDKSKMSCDVDYLYAILESDNDKLYYGRVPNSRASYESFTLKEVTLRRTTDSAVIKSFPFQGRFLVQIILFKGRPISELPIRFVAPLMYRGATLGPLAIPRLFKQHEDIIIAHGLNAYNFPPAVLKYPKTQSMKSWYRIGVSSNPTAVLLGKYEKCYVYSVKSNSVLAPPPPKKKKRKMSRKVSPATVFDNFGLLTIGFLEMDDVAAYLKVARIVEKMPQDSFNVMAKIKAAKILGRPSMF